MKRTSVIFLNLALFTFLLVPLLHNTSILAAGTAVSSTESLPLEKLVQAAEGGNPEAQFFLGKRYYSGSDPALPADPKKAVEWYQKAADQGFAKAQNNLAICYEKGQGVEQSFKKADEWYKKAAENGSTNAKVNIELLKNHNNFRTIGLLFYEQHSNTISVLLEVIPKITIIFLIATCVLYALRIIKLVLRFLIKKLRNQFQLLKITINGNIDSNSEQDKNNIKFHITRFLLALKSVLVLIFVLLLQLLKNIVSSKCIKFLGGITFITGLITCYINVLRFTDEKETRIKETIEWFLQAAESENIAKHGLPQIHFNLAYCYESGRGDRQSPKEAVKYLTKAAEQGLAEAQLNLANSYFKGYGIDQSPEKAVEWWKRAAEQGLAQAQFNLALCYEKGLGVEQSVEEAAKWREKIKDQKFSGTQFCLTHSFYKDRFIDTLNNENVSSTTDKNHAVNQFKIAISCVNNNNVKKSFKYFKKAAKQGLAEAQFNLGICYLYGLGNEHSYKNSAKWLKLSCEPR